MLPRRKKPLKSKSNGTPKSHDAHDTPATPQSMKSPQPSVLTEEERTDLRKWLDNTEQPFSVQIRALSNKRKLGSDALLQQTNLFDKRLSAQYEVKPQEKWESMKRFKKFTIGEDSPKTFEPGQCILVRHDDVEDPEIDLDAQWKARVLEIRALDAQHVYIRVAWLYKPDELTSGRQPHHGRRELIPSNYMDVIDAMTVNGGFEIAHWDESDEDSAPTDEQQYFWRQTCDFTDNGALSPLKKICIDQTPQNPDEMILQCSDPACKKWMHVKCIAETAVHQAADTTQNDSKRKPPSRKARLKAEVTVDTDSAARAKATTEAYSAEVFIQGLPNGEGQVAVAAAEKTEIVVTALRAGVDADADAVDGEEKEKEKEGKERRWAVSCLFCGKEVE